MEEDKEKLKDEEKIVLLIQKAIKKLEEIEEDDKQKENILLE